MNNLTYTRWDGNISKLPFTELNFITLSIRIRSKKYIDLCINITYSRIAYPIKKVTDLKTL